MVGHADGLTPVLLALALILMSAKLGGDIAERFGQPAVLGELLAGIILGNLQLPGGYGLGWIARMAPIDLLAQLGVILLLFEVGLESTVGDMRKVGFRAFLVAVLGVLAPWALGWWVSAFMLPTHGSYTHLYIGATLTATSVGITARVFKDLGRAQSAEARVILGAAVIDDVLGLVILAGVTSAVAAANTGAPLSYWDLGWVFMRALAFLVVALAVGTLVTPRLFWLASRLRGHGVLLATALALCFTLGAAASKLGLAPIVGAYAAGLLLEELHFRDFRERGEHRLEELVRPLSSFLVPIFFLLMGARVDLRALARPEVAGLGVLLTVAAVLGKQACALGALGTRLSGMTIGLGMIPRGEVGLIFASIGLALQLHGEPVIDARVYAAVVTVVMATTLITPPALRWSLTRRGTRVPARPTDRAAAEHDSSHTALMAEGGLTEQSAAEG